MRTPTRFMRRQRMLLGYLTPQATGIEFKLDVEWGAIGCPTPSERALLRHRGSAIAQEPPSWGAKIISVSSLDLVQRIQAWRTIIPQGGWFANPDVWM